MQDRGFSVRETQDGGYILTGETRSFGDTLGDVYVIRTGPQGDTLWTRVLGGTRPDRGTSVQQVRDGGYIIAGGTESFGKWRDAVYLAKLSPLGETLWERTYDGYDSEWGSSVQQTTDDGYIVVGSTSSFGSGEYDVYLVKTDSLGTAVWTKTYGGAFLEYGNSVHQNTDGGYIIAGMTTSYGAGGFDFYVVRTDANGSSQIEERSEAQPQRPREPIRVAPNPFTSFAILPGHEAENFAIYDISGRLAGTYRGDHIGGDLPPGVYFLRGHIQNSPPIRVVKVR